MSQPLRLIPQAAQSIVFLCPICEGQHAAYIFGSASFRVHRCGGCGLTFGKSSSADRNRLGPDPVSREPSKVDRSEEDYAALLGMVQAAKITQPILVFADEGDEVISFLESRGLQIGQIVSGKSVSWEAEPSEFGAAIVSDILMRAENPKALIDAAYRALSPGLPVFFNLPLLDGRQARLMGRNWHQWRAANKWYFTRETLSLLLLSAGLERIWFRSERRRYSLDALTDRLGSSVDPGVWQRALGLATTILPRRLRSIPFMLPAGTAAVTSTVGARKSESLLSIIVPVFDEARTFRAMMDELLTKELPNIRKEIIIVESNSTDGSRELALSYESHPDVKLILQEAPRGKGNAVRQGFAHAKGDILMIQDADLEYDVDDYDGLLAPVAAWQSMFVLGSRHQGTWKMRTFTDAPLLGAIFNFGHTFFRSLMNGVTGANMMDPFTMFKVFRRDAIHGLSFECNRFDFDIELVIKLIRKGYMPLEIPVNYSSRSFADGKKVSITRDGLTWIRTILRARFARLDAARARE